MGDTLETRALPCFMQEKWSVTRIHEVSPFSPMCYLSWCTFGSNSGRGPIAILVISAPFKSSQSPSEHAMAQQGTVSLKLVRSGHVQCCPAG